MRPALPRFRRDLVVTPQRDEAGLAYVVKDPATGRFFRFRAPEHFITQQLDGATPPEAVRARIGERFGQTPSSSSFAEFLGDLDRHGLLEGDGDGAAERGHLARRRLVRGSFLYLRFKAIDPDRILGRLIGGLGFFFTPWFVAASAAVILAGAVTTVSEWGAIHRDLGRLYNLDALVLVYLTVLAVGMAHEFAHGLTCKRFGGEVREMGFMLLYLQPALYCNVSDAWLFPEKWKRLWVTFAGAYFELFIWGLATLAWRVTAPETWLNLAALVVMATSGAKTFFNFNPLIKLDGYYLLSDYLEIPNLRKRSFDHLWGLVRGRAEEATDRERRIFLTYGLLAGAFTLWLLTFLASRLAGFLVTNLQGLGFVLFVLLFASILRRRFPRLLRTPRAVTRLRGRVAVRMRPSLALVAAGAGLALLFLVPLPLNVTGEFTVLPIHNADVRSELEGIIEEVHVAEGDAVREGAPVARLSARRYRADLGKTAASLEEREARLRMLVAGPTLEEIELARRELATARTRSEETRRRHAEAERMLAERRAKAEIAAQKAEVHVTYSRMNLDRFKELSQAGLVSALQYDEAAQRAAVSAKDLEEARAEVSLMFADTLAETRREVMIAEMEIGQAEAKLAKLLAGSRKEEIEATRAEIALFDTERRHLEAQMDLLTVTSPITGVVTTPARQLAEMVGKLVRPGDLIAEVYELKALTVEIAVPEKEIAEVRVGQPVTLKARAYPDRAFRGEVTSIATTLRDEPDPAAAGVAARGAARMVRVATRLDNSDLLLKPEMTGVAKIAAGKRSLARLLTRRLTRYLKVEFWSWW